MGSLQYKLSEILSSLLTILSCACLVSLNTIDSKPKLPKDCSLILRFHLVEKRPYPTIDCTFGRLRRQEVLPIFEMPAIERLDLIWFDSCLPPYTELPDGSFSKMSNVFHLYLNGCIKSNITSNTFAGLHKLESLSIGMPGFEYDRDYVTTFEPDWLQPIQGLTLLYVRDMNAPNFPAGHFCGLQHLKYLNLSHNWINKTEGFGVKLSDSESSAGKACLPNLTHLDISHNSIATLDMTDMPLLHVLYAQNCGISNVIGLGHLMIMGLQDINLSNNRLSSLTVNGVEECHMSNMSKLQLQDNRLTRISRDLFACTKYLMHINLARNRLSHETLMESGLHNLDQLEYLNLDENNITLLQATMIGPHLKVFKCRRCGLRTVEKDVFANSTNLSQLDLRENVLLVFEPQNTLSSLTQLHLGGNRLQQVSSFGGSWPGLFDLDLSDNEITVWETNNFCGFYNLTTLRMADNNISHISQYALICLLHLKFLDLSRNSIQKVESMAFIVPRFTNIDLDFNKITDLDTFLLPLEKSTRLSLRGNRITRIYKNMIALKSIEWMDFSQNMIYYIEEASFRLPRLRFVNLTYNRIHRLDGYVLLAGVGISQEARPQILLEGNLLRCDCNNEYLQKINSQTTFEEFMRTAFNALQPYNRRRSIDEILSTAKGLVFAQVPDLDKLQCHFFPRLDVNTSVVSLDRTSFLCQRQAKDEGCDCCHENDTECACCTVCDRDCHCYGSMLHNRNIVACASRNLTEVPQGLPVYATEIELQYNYIETLGNGAFTYSNSGHIGPLNKLLLNNNNIWSISERAFNNISSLETLTLHNNSLRTIDLKIFGTMPSLKLLSLYGNCWECDCKFGPEFQKFVRQNIDIIYKAQLIYCKYEKPLISDGNFTTTSSVTNAIIATTEEILNIDFDFCKNSSVLTEIEHRKVVLVEGMVSMGVVFLFIGSIVIFIYKNLLFLRIWAYNKFGARWYNERQDDDDKPYDVYIAYALDDDRFVVEDFLPELEQRVMSYAVLVESRDWPADDIMTETIIASVQQSKRTILLVSDNFFGCNWCRYKFQMAHLQVLKDKQPRLIVVLTDRNLTQYMESDMKIYLKTGTSLVYGEKYFWQKLRYYLADNPRGDGGGFRPLNVYRQQAV